MNMRKRTMLFCVSLISILIFTGNVLAQQGLPPGIAPQKTYAVILNLGSLNAGAPHHVFCISENGNEFKVWDTQKNNERNSYRLTGFKKNINYFVLILSYHETPVLSPNVIHFFKDENDRGFIRSIPLDKMEKQPQSPDETKQKPRPSIPSRSPKKLRI